MTEHTEYIAEPWFSLIKLGIKKCEGRFYKDKIKEIKTRDIIIFKNNDLGTERLCKVEVRFRRFYDSFQQLLLHESLDACLPGLDTLEEGLNVYKTKKDGENCQVVALGIKIIDNYLEYDEPE